MRTAQIIEFPLPPRRRVINWPSVLIWLGAVVVVVPWWVGIITLWRWLT